MPGKPAFAAGSAVQAVLHEGLRIEVAARDWLMHHADRVDHRELAVLIERVEARCAWMQTPQSAAVGQRQRGVCSARGDARGRAGKFVVRTKIAVDRGHETEAVHRAA